MAGDQYISLLPPEHYDAKKGRYTRLAFKNSAGGGVSVIAVDCALATSGSLCAHIARFYPRRLKGDPPAFWRFRAPELASGSVLAQSPSASGDMCHHDIIGMSDNDCSRLLKTRSTKHLEICDANGLRAMAASDLPPT